MPCRISRCPGLLSKHERVQMYIRLNSTEHTWTCHPPQLFPSCRGRCHLWNEWYCVLEYASLCKLTRTRANQSLMWGCAESPKPVVSARLYALHWTVTAHLSMCRVHFITTEKPKTEHLGWEEGQSEHKQEVSGSVVEWEHQRGPCSIDALALLLSSSSKR